MRDGARVFFFFQVWDIFLYLRTFKTETLQIYSLIAQALKQLFPSVSVPSEKHLSHRFMAR